ncbi:MAG TPA: polysaccharide deacetylase family protein, partial [Gemmatimonadaceae bacterium]|nr:polysaccharide deacetylase family protein [Gemmatimonadaceae bacterium]
MTASASTSRLGAELAGDRTARSALVVVNFHYVRPSFDEPYPGIHGITPAQLEEQLCLLGDAGTFVSAAHVRDAARGRRALPERAVLVTFDDGLREQFENALPVLDRLGVPALFFVNTAPIANGTVSAVHRIHILRAYVSPRRVVEMLHEHAERRGVNLAVGSDDAKATAQYRYDSLDAARLKFLLNFQLDPRERDALVADCFAERFSSDERAQSKRLYMDLDQIRTLALRGMLGTHGHEHLPLGMLDADTLRGCVRDSVHALRSWTGERPFALSYPYGSLPACSRS